MTPEWIKDQRGNMENTNMFGGKPKGNWRN